MLRVLAPAGWKTTLTRGCRNAARRRAAGQWPRGSVRELRTSAACLDGAGAPTGGGEGDSAEGAHQSLVYTQKPSEEHLAHVFVDELNARLRVAPLASFASFIGIQYAVFLPLFQACTLLEVQMPELAVAYFIAAPMKRLRLPIDVGAAAVLARAFPPLSRVEVMALLLPPTRDQSGKQLQRPKWLEWLEGPINKYGAAMLVARAGNGMLTLLALGTAVKMGLDVTALREYFGIPEQFQDTAGAMAVAGTLTTLTLPLRLGVLPFVVDWVLSRGGNSASEGTVRRAS